MHPLQLILWLTALPLAAQAVDRVVGAPFVTRAEVIAPQGMAATSQPLATQVALDILKAGGTAVDAAIAANAALGLMEPTGNGIGGDLYAIVWDPDTRKLHGLNGSGRSPRGLSLEALHATLAEQGLDAIPPRGPLPVSIPGTVDAWFALHERFGTLPMRDILAPTIRYARDGHPVAELIAHYWARSVPLLSPYPGFTEQFTVDGRAPAKGDMWRNPHLARTLEQIAKGGRDAFYDGPMTQVMVDYLQAQGGAHALADFRDHRSEWVTPVSVPYRGYEVWELPPNTQGIAALQMLRLLEAYDFAPADFGTARHVHLFTEAKKLAYEDRARYYADPDFSPPPLQRLLSKDYADERRPLIDPERAAKRVDAGNVALRQGDTIYLTTADRQGMMVSLIQSNYRGMGSGMTPPGLGFIFQDRGELFTLEEGHANVYAPGKRPFQTIIPAFITKDGKPWVSFGVMGGDMQPQGHVQIVMNLIDFGMNLQEAGDAPRIYHTGSSEPTGSVMTDGGVLALESGFPRETIRTLQQYGHTVTWNLHSYGGYQAIMRQGGVYFGASESRKDGQAAGY
ncbi:MAG: gamma-glutamyltransferase [Oceanococcaceae bacterium]